MARRVKGMSAMVRRICIAVLLALLTTASVVVASAAAAGAAADAYVNE
jgi:hypothetical protein